MNRRAPIFLVADGHASTVAQFLSPDEQIRIFNEEPIEKRAPVNLDPALSFAVRVRVIKTRNKPKRFLRIALLKPNQPK